MTGIETRRVIQVAIAVRDLDAMIERWTALLGFGPTDVVDSRDLQTTEPTYRGETTQAHCRLAVFDLGQCKLELMEPIGAPSVWDEHLTSRGESLHHIAFAVDRLENGISRFEELEIAVAQQGDFGTGRYAYLDSAPSLGTIIELLEFFPRDPEAAP
jgi:methylmalonyl-CoA/ethylmalonyl-CoA epimerase